jgi:hypothetical protein
MNYKEKYIKYKSKYNQLKKVLIGGAIRETYIKKVEIFENDTKPNYINSELRNLNTITINRNDEYGRIKGIVLDNINSIIKNICDNLYSNFVEVNDVVQLLQINSNEIIEIEGFNNIYIDYKNNKSNGTCVKYDDRNTIFKESSRFKFKAIDNFGGENAFCVSIGTGKINLNQTMIKYRNTGVKYVILEAAGQYGLVDAYTKYGFKILLSKFKYFDNTSTQPLMYSNINDVIVATNP